jgi:hypothetical protein
LPFLAASNNFLALFNSLEKYLTSASFSIKFNLVYFSEVIGLAFLY